MFVLGASFWARYLEVARLELLALTTLETNDPATRARLEAKGDTALAIQLVARLKPDELHCLAAAHISLTFEHVVERAPASELDGLLEICEHRPAAALSIAAAHLQSVALSGTQWYSVVISGTSAHSVAIREPQPVPPLTTQ